MIGKGLITSIALLLTLAAPPLARAAPSTYTDPAGDNGDAPDIGAVTVQLAADGYIHIRPTIANQPAIQTPGGLLIFLDTDRSLATGGLGGADYVFAMLFEPVEGALLRWNGSDWDYADTQQDDARYLVGSSGFELLVRPAVLGGATSFNFSVAAAGAVPEQMDVAPDQGMWLFEPPTAAVVERLDARFVPAAPKAGAIFRPATVRAELSDGTAAPADSYRCVASLGGRLLRGTGRGGCTFKVPANAKGKRLVVTLHVTYKGTTLKSKPYVFRVR